MIFEAPAASVAGPDASGALQVEEERTAGGVVPAGHGVGAVTYVPFEQPTVEGPKPPGAAGDA